MSCERHSSCSKEVIRENFVVIEFCYKLLFKSLHFLFTDTFSLRDLLLRLTEPN